MGDESGSPGGKGADHASGAGGDGAAAVASGDTGNPAGTSGAAAEGGASGMISVTGGNGDRAGADGAAGGDAGGAGGAGVGTAGASAMGGAGGAGGSHALGGTGGSNGCLENVSEYASQGPFEHEMAGLPDDGILDRVKVWAPRLPADCRAPIVHFGVGTGGACATYLPTLEHLASHGFLVTCYESPRADAGMLCLAAVETALEHYSELADHKVGALGHHTGAAAAIQCVGNIEETYGDALTIVGHAAEPASGTGGGQHPSGQTWSERYAQVSSPVFMFNGGQDVLVSESWVGRAFDALNPAAEAYWYEGVEATHVPVPASYISESAVLFLRWKLLGDREACEAFKALPETDAWDMKGERNPSDC